MVNREGDERLLIAFKTAENHEIRARRRLTAVVDGIFPDPEAERDARIAVQRAEMRTVIARRQWIGSIQ